MKNLMIAGTVQHISLETFIDRLKSVKLFVLDVDGVLTDAGMYYSEQGDELKKFNTRDGMGIKRVMKIGVQVAIITGENTQLVKRRADKLGINIIHQGIDDKLPVLKKLISTLGIRLDQVAYIGDDLGDVECLTHVSVPCTVKDGLPQNRNAAVYITELAGGQGAVREVCDLLLQVGKGK